MDIVNEIAANWFGISGTELIIIGVVTVVALGALVAIRAFVKITFRVMALGCVTILGIALGLWLLFVVLS